MKKTLTSNNLMKDITQKLANHATLIGARINPDQALRISFGDKFANEAIKQVKEMEVAK